MPNQPPLNPDVKRKCVHLLLAYSGTPWDDLYEYPHRRDDSDRYIANAEKLLDQIIAAVQPEGWELQAKNFMRVIDRLSAENEALKAAALPEVTSVEELDQLPIGAVVQSGRYPENEAFGLYRKFSEELWLFSEGSAFRGLSIGLPARVLYRPEVNDA